MVNQIKFKSKDMPQVRICALGPVRCLHAHAPEAAGRTPHSWVLDSRALRPKHQQHKSKASPQIQQRPDVTEQDLHGWGCRPPGARTGAGGPPTQGTPGCLSAPPAHTLPENRAQRTALLL